MMASNKTAALGWLGAQPEGSTLATTMASITDLQFRGLQLWLINLLPTWGSLVYNSWLTQGGGGLLTTRPVYDLLYGAVIAALPNAAVVGWWVGVAVCIVCAVGGRWKAWHTAYSRAAGVTSLLLKL